MQCVPQSPFTSLLSWKLSHFTGDTAQAGEGQSASRNLSSGRFLASAIPKLDCSLGLGYTAFKAFKSSGRGSGEGEVPRNLQ